MPRINPEGQITRAERLATVVAIAGAVLVHLVVILGWGRLSRWTLEEQKKERLMVIRRVRDVAPPNLPPPPQRQRPASEPAGDEGAAPAGKRGAPPPPLDPKVREQGPEPPKESELSPEMERDLREEQPGGEPVPEQGDNAVSVVTDLPAASFIVAGAAQQYRGSGTFWVRKGAPPGVYTTTFNPVAGFATPPVQTKELTAKGQVVFFGKYRRSTEIVVESNEAAAQFTIIRPDGRPIDLNRPGRALLDDLPPGVYTAVFKDVPGHITPAPLAKSLAPGGKLSFYGEYRDAPADRLESSKAGGEGGDGDESLGKSGRGRRGGKTGGSGGGDAGDGSGAGRKSRTAPLPEDLGYDRRVRLVVKSYPKTNIESDFDPIPYPEIIISKGNFKQGWCQVWLEIKVDERGEIETIDIQRPAPEERERYRSLIDAVLAAVRSWDYDRVSAEVNVDVLFYVE